LLPRGTTKEHAFYVLSNARGEGKKRRDSLGGHQPFQKEGGPIDVCRGGGIYLVTKRRRRELSMLPLTLSRADNSNSMQEGKKIINERVVGREAYVLEKKGPLHSEKEEGVFLRGVITNRKDEIFRIYEERKGRRGLSTYAHAAGHGVD